MDALRQESRRSASRDQRSSPAVRSSGRLSFAAASLVALTLAAPAAQAQGTRNSPLGTNVSEVAFWSTQIVFKDMFRQSSRWLPQESNGWAWDTGQPLDLDNDGWVQSLAPGQAAGKILAHDIEGHYPSGVYTLRYEGTGTFEIYLDGTVIQSNPGEILVDVDATNAGVHIKLVDTDPNDPARNIEFIIPGHANDDLDAEPFLPAFLQSLEPFGTIRFMQWQHTNDSDVVSWDERPTPAYSTQAAGPGVSIEFMIQLCNTLGADPWLCVPHLADDDFVENMAELVEANLEPGLRVCVEYSNEVWNSIYSQSSHARNMGVAQGLSSDHYQAGLRWYSQRAVEIFEIFHDVFDGQEDRVVRVLAGHHANPWTGKQILGWNRAYQHADAYATAPYFGGGLGSESNAPTVSTWSVAQVLQACNDSVTEVIQHAEETAEYVERVDLAFLAYEGGQHLVGVGSAVENQALTDLFIATNRHPRMRDLYRRLLDGWRMSGARSFVTWNSMELPSKWGSWGLSEHLGDLATSHKYRAVRDFVDANPVWW